LPSSERAYYEKGSILARPFRARGRFLLIPITRVAPWPEIVCPFGAILLKFKRLIDEVIDGKTKENSITPDYDFILCF
jgi:hypothetical protein